MKGGQVLLNGYYIALCLVAFTIPLLNILSSISIILAVLFWLLSGQYKHVIKNLKEKPILIGWIVFFLYHAASYFWSTDKNQSLFDTQTKLSFFVLPIIISANNNFSVKWLTRILLSFTTVVTLSAVFCIARAIITYASTGATAQFFYHPLVQGFEPNAVYFAWYVLFTISALLFINLSGYPIIHYKAIRYFSILILIVFFILLSSRLLLVLGILMLLPMYYRKQLSTFTIKSKILIVGALALIILMIAIVPNPIRTRYKSALTATKQQGISPEGKPNLQFSDLTLRPFIWKMGWQNINEHNLWWYGCGNGDVKTLQTEKVYKDYASKGYDLTYTANLGNYDMHNMYLQALYMLGIPGLLLLVWLVFTPFFYINRLSLLTRPFWVFHISSVFFMAQEAILQTQVGIVPYTFFTMLFWAMVNKKITSPLLQAA